MVFVELIVVLSLLTALFFLARRDMDTSFFGLFWRGYPKVQVRRYPPFNGRLAGANAIIKKEHGVCDVKVRTSTFGKPRLVENVPQQLLKGMEFNPPHTMHKEGLFVIPEWQPHVQTGDPVVDLLKNTLFWQEQNLKNIHFKLTTIEEGLKRHADPNLAMRAIGDIRLEYRKMLEDVERRKEETEKLIMVEMPKEQKHLEKPPREGGNIMPK